MYGDKLKRSVMYCFDAETGNTKKYKSIYFCAKSLGFSTHSTVFTALTKGNICKDRYYFSYSYPTKKQQLDTYLHYWRIYEVPYQESWRWVRGLQVSSYGRVKTRDGEWIIPRDPGQNRHKYVKRDGKTHNLAHLVVEAFILMRPISEDERVTKIGQKYDYRPTNLKVISKEAQATKWNRLGYRSNSKEVALVDDEGEIVEVYQSISEAGRRNYISQSAISHALKDNRKIFNKRFILVEELFKDEES